MDYFGGIAYQICHGTGVEGVKVHTRTHTHTHTHAHARIFHGSVSVLQRQWAVEQVIYSKSLSSVVIISKGFLCLLKNCGSPSVLKYNILFPISFLLVG
jgi:hypothetical protein